MAIYPIKKKVRKASSGMLSDDDSAQVVDTTIDAMSAIPAVGGLVQAGLGTANSIGGEGSNMAGTIVKDTMGTGQIETWMSANSLEDAFRAVDPIANAVASKDDYDRAKLKRQMIKRSQAEILANRKSNVAFGELTYKEGGEIEEPPLFGPKVKSDSTRFKDSAKSVVAKKNIESVPDIDWQNYNSVLPIKAKIAASPETRANAAFVYTPPGGISAYDSVSQAASKKFPFPAGGELSPELRTAIDAAAAEKLKGKQEYFKKRGAKATYFEDGGILLDGEPSLDDDQAVILDGKSHEDGGNDVVDSSSGEKVAETEREELIFSASQTNKIEKHIAAYEQSKDKADLIYLGECVADIINNKTVDHSKKIL